MKKKIKNKRLLFLFSFFVCSIVNSQEIKILKDSILINSDYFMIEEFKITSNYDATYLRCNFFQNLR